MTVSKFTDTMERDFLESTLLRSSKLRAVVICLVFVYCVILSSFDTKTNEQADPTALRDFRAIASAVIVPLLLFRVSIHWSPEIVASHLGKWFDWHWVEKVDMALWFLICVSSSMIVCIGNVSISSLIIISLISMPIAFPARFRSFVPVVIAVIVFHLLALRFIGQQNTTFVLILGMLLTFPTMLVTLGMIQLELTLRDNFILRKRTEADSEERVRMAMSLVTQTEQLGKAKSRMVSVVSHELRSPCQAISGMCNILMSSKLCDEDRECVNIINRSSDLLISIINDFLNFARLDADQITLKEEQVSVVDVVEDVLDFVSLNAYKGKQIELFSQFASDLPGYVLTDGERLKQILLNLSANAVKFCEKGHVCISVRMASEEEMDEWTQRKAGDDVAHRYMVVPPGSIDLKRKYLAFSVSDTGIGLDQACLSKIFDEFFMVDPGPSRKYNGTGLGLAIVKRLVLLMQGSIRVNSKGPNCGATFEVLLPLHPCPMPFVPIFADQPVERSPIDAPYLGLVVNRNPSARENLERCLSSRFHIPCIGLSDLNALQHFVEMEDECEEGLLFGDVTTSAFFPHKTPRQKLSSFLESAQQGSGPVHFSANAPRLSIVVFLDNNIAESPVMALDIIRHCNRIGNPQSTDILISPSDPNNMLPRPQLRFKFIFVSPVHDGNEQSSLSSLGYFSKLSKPIKNSAGTRLIRKIVEIDQKPETWRLRFSLIGGEIQSSKAQMQPLSTLLSSQSSSVSSRISSKASSEGCAPGSAGREHSVLLVPVLEITVSNTNPTNELLPVLVVDDNKVNQKVFTRMLQGLYACDVASDGIEAVQMVAKKDYVCVLMDFHMERLDGITATRQIRALRDSKSNTPVVGLSADSQTEIQEEARAAGMNRFLSKPIKKEPLLKAIAEVRAEHTALSIARCKLFT